MSTWQQLDTAGRPCWSLDLLHGIRVLIYGPAAGRELQQYVITVEVVQASGATTFLGRATSAEAAGQVRIETLGTAKGQVTYVTRGSRA